MKEIKVMVAFMLISMFLVGCSNYDEVNTILIQQNTEALRDSLSKCQVKCAENSEWHVLYESDACCLLHRIR